MGVGYGCVLGDEMVLYRYKFFVAKSLDHGCIYQTAGGGKEPCFDLAVNPDFGEDANNLNASGGSKFWSRVCAELFRRFTMNTTNRRMFVETLKRGVTNRTTRVCETSCSH